MALSHRIISLIPSATEIVAALGGAGRLVGRSHECDFPPDVAGLPALTAPRFDPTAPSRTIDRDVRALLHDGLSPYRLDAAGLKALAPDLVLTQAQCDACAVGLDQVEAALCDWVGHPVTVISLSPTRLDEVWADIGRVAEALDLRTTGEALVAGLRERVAAVAATAAAAPDRPSIACVEWLDPLMSAGHWVPEMVALAGGAGRFGEIGAPAAPLEWEELVHIDPDILAFMPCGFGIGRTRSALPVLSNRFGWEWLTAARSGRVFLVDGHHYFNRPGPRLVDSLEILAELLHPASFPSAHRGSGWQPL